MKKYLPFIVEALTGPKPVFNTSIFSPARILNKRKMLAQCRKQWKYKKTQELSQQIAFTFLNLSKALKQHDQSLVLRYVSIDLFEKYKQNPQMFALEDKISDVVILDCIKNMKEDQSQWYQLYVKIKHFKLEHCYSLERKIFIDNFHYESPTARKWHFIDLPLKVDQK